MACKYFHWGDPEKIKWEMPFNELMLYLGSIPQYQAKGEPKIEENAKDIMDIFQ